ncbi:AraC family transcriptional regulator ligand-binding domain-containing protein [Streptomyces sp. NPDC051976]|uniref:AraC family transcriptional regulator n=1 Tax=Streptomyces sp. NPDC051976 TaxID=3154947 RepID=UPI0034246EA3
MSRETLLTNFSRRLTVLGTREGLDMPQLLHRLGIAATDGLPAGPVNIAQSAALVQEMWMLTGDELFGLGPPTPLGSFALMMRSAIHVPDLRSLLRRMAQASNVLTGMPKTTVSESTALVTVELDTAGFKDPEHVGAEFVAVLTHRMLAWAVGRRLPLAAVELPWPAPPYVAEYETLFGVHPKLKRAELRLVLSADQLTYPVVRTEDDLDGYLNDQPRVWFRRRDYESSIEQQVRTILDHGLRGAWPTAEEAAGRLNISAQHLRRLLRAENTSIGMIKEDIMRQAAIASLERGDESVNALAARLGFSEPSAFRRAFRRWTNAAPGTYKPRP